jgi:hypothetical protein
MPNQQVRADASEIRRPFSKRRWNFAFELYVTEIRATGIAYWITQASTYMGA